MSNAASPEVNAVASDAWARRLSSVFWFGAGIGVGSVALGMLTLVLYEPLQLPFGVRVVFVRVGDFAELSLWVAIAAWVVAAVAGLVRRRRGGTA